MLDGGLKGVGGLYTDVAIGHDDVWGVPCGNGTIGKGLDVSFIRYIVLGAAGGSRDPIKAGNGNQLFAVSYGYHAFGPSS